MILTRGMYYIGDPTFVIPDEKSDFIWGTIL
jgi:hypothetical protein